MSGNSDEKEHHDHVSFEDSARKFKPGPVAPPESEAHRRHMGEAEELAESAPGRAADFMPEGEPGVFKKMPGED